jgi:undecaprenyl-diphosphatase
LVNILTFDGFFGTKFDILKPRWLPTLTSVLVPIVILWPATAILAVLLACCLAWARVATAHHFPSDVFAGAVLGVGVGYPISLGLISLW